MNCPFLVKVCTKCKRILIANENNFRKKKEGKYGLNSQCRTCLEIYTKEYNKKYRENNLEKVREKERSYYRNNKEKRKDYNKEYRKEHKEQLKDYNKEYRKENKEELKKKKQEYYKENREKILKKQQEYYKNNPHIGFNNAQKRRHKLESQGRGIFKEQWLEMMEFFDWKCAYSGIQLDKSNRSIDHMISLSNGGENEPWNCIPVLKKYNCEKYTSNMFDWFLQQDFFLEERMYKILEWITYSYMKWGKVE